MCYLERFFILKYCGVIGLSCSMLYLERFWSECEIIGKTGKIGYFIWKDFKLSM
jgi:hypothetical protein